MPSKPSETSAEMLMALAERCEGASGANRVLDCLIFMATNGIPSVCGKRLVEEDESPAYTASLDAAMTLVPEGWAWSAGSNPEPSAHLRRNATPGAKQRHIQSRAATPTLALTAACLRALASESAR